VVGILLGKLGFIHAGKWPNVNDATAFERAGQFVRAYTAKGESKFADWVRLLRLRDPAQTFRFLLVLDADQSLDIAIAKLRAQFPEWSGRFDPTHGSWITIVEPARPELPVAAWYSMDAATGTGSMDTYSARHSPEHMAYSLIPPRSSTHSFPTCVTTHWAEPCSTTCCTTKPSSELRTPCSTQNASTTAPFATLKSGKPPFSTPQAHSPHYSSFCAQRCSQFTNIIGSTNPPKSNLSRSVSFQQTVWRRRHAEPRINPLGGNCVRCSGSGKPGVGRAAGVERCACFVGTHV
jgi:hypothetical protein